MALIIFVGLIVLTLGMLVLLSSQAKNRDYLVPVWLGWVGSMLVASAFLAMPWAVTGPHGAFERNAGWLADQGTYFDLLRRLPVVQDYLASLKLDTTDNIRLLLDRPESHRFLEYVESGGPISAWQLMPMARQVSLWFPVALVGGLLAALLALIASLLSPSFASELGARLGMGSGIVAAISLVLLLGKLPFIDTLGTTDNFAVRLITALGEVRVATGGWWMAVGLFVVVCSAVLFLILGRSFPRPDHNDAAWYGTSGWLE